MTLANKNIVILQCPSCGGCIKSEPTTSFAKSEIKLALVCTSCGRIFPVIGGVPDFTGDILLSDENTKLVEWREKLALQEYWWHKERDKKVLGSKPFRPKAEIIEMYLSLGTVNAGQGRILDIGCADGNRSSHFISKNYFGIDPIVFSNFYSFPFFRAIAEALPFSDDVFDVVVFIESIDHFFDPSQALNEAVRVLSIGGAICIFVRNNENGETTGGDNGFGTAHYTISEEDVHIHRFSEEYFRDKLSLLFERVEVIYDKGFLAVWGWSKKVEKAAGVNSV